MQIRTYQAKVRVYNGTYNTTNNENNYLDSSMQNITLHKDVLPANIIKGSHIHLGGYSWLVLADDGTNVTLVEDWLYSSGHCTNDTDPNTDCGVNERGQLMYTWDKSLIRTQLSSMYPIYQSKIGNTFVSTDICIDGYSYDSTGAGLTRQEIEYANYTCINGYVSDYVRLLTVNEAIHYNYNGGTFSYYDDYITKTTIYNDGILNTYTTTPAPGSSRSVWYSACWNITSPCRVTVLSAEPYSGHYRPVITLRKS